LDRKKSGADCVNWDKAAAHPRVLAALATQSEMWPEVRTELGELQPRWITAEALFANAAAIDEYLDYEGSFRTGTDRKTCAAAMMVDYCYIFSIATVPLFVGFGMVPDLSPSLFALQFYTGSMKHDGQTFEVRRAHVRYLPAAFSFGREGYVHGLGADMLPDGGLCDLYRRAVEMHFEPLVKQLRAATGLSRNALWRLVADGIAGCFLDAGTRFDRLAQAKVSAMTVLKQPGSPLNNRQLHYFDLTIADDGQNKISHTFRSRGGCCRYYTVEDGELCSTCVLKPPTARDEELRAAMRRHFGLGLGDAV